MSDPQQKPGAKVRRPARRSDHKQGRPHRGKTQVNKRALT